MMTGMTDSPSASRWSTSKWISLWVTLISIGLLGLSIPFPRVVLFHWTIIGADPSNGDYVPVVWSFGFAVLGFAVLIGYWFCAAIFLWLRGMHRLGNEAHAPIPSLAEIERQLRAVGYDPSIADCVAIEQHLKSERNEKAVVYGALLIGGLAAGRVANGKPPFPGMGTSA